MQENLLGYLLGALDGPDHEKIRLQLENDPQLRAELSELESKLIPLEEERWQHEPPAGLAAATCKMVAQHSAQATPRNAKPYRTQGMSRSDMSEWNPRKHGWDMVDAVVAAGIFIAAAMLFFPAIANSRQQSRQLACQNNLRQASMGLQLYGANNRGVFPYIPTQGKTSVAGYYAPQLVESGYLTQNASFLCPSSQLASQNYNSFSVPSIEEIEAAEGEELINLQQTMGGSYTYSMGHMEHGQHRATRNRGRSYFPIMADGFESSPGAGSVSAHGGRGINVAFEGGNVRYIVNLTRQHPYFVSDRGLVEAGTHVNDPVLGHSWSRPSTMQYVGKFPQVNSPRPIPAKRIILRIKFKPQQKVVPEFEEPQQSDLMSTL